MAIFKSVARFTKVEPVTSDFVKALTNTFVNFSFAYVNIQQSIFALAANKSIRVNHDFMQVRQAFKKF